MLNCLTQRRTWYKEINKSLINFWKKKSEIQKSKFQNIIYFYFSGQPAACGSVFISEIQSDGKHSAISNHSGHYKKPTNFAQPTQQWTHQKCARQAFLFLSGCRDSNTRHTMEKGKNTIYVFLLKWRQVWMFEGASLNCPKMSKVVGWNEEVFCSEFWVYYIHQNMYENWGKIILADWDISNMIELLIVGTRLFENGSLISWSSTYLAKFPFFSRLQTSR